MSDDESGGPDAGSVPARNAVIRNREALPDDPATATALDCIEAGIAAAAPEQVVCESVAVDGEDLRVDDERYGLASRDRVLVLGGGKAARGVASALSAVLGDRLDGGLVVAPDPGGAGPVDVAAGDHPLPTAASADATRELLARAETAGETDLVLAPITGGASALLAAPAGDLSVGDLRATTESLLDAGVDIHDLNAVRKHLSAVKGGQLAQVAAPATVVTLVFSDVVGDDPAVVGSGPTVPDPTTYGDALAVLESVDAEFPPGVSAHLRAGRAGTHAETPTAAVLGSDVHVLASVRTAIDAAVSAARERALEPVILSSRVRGEAREVARVAVAVAEEIRDHGDPVSPPAVVLAGGETTVSVRGEGTGGPNLEYALSAALELHAGRYEGGLEIGAAEGRIVVAAVDTDGLDGSTDLAGAVVDRETLDTPAAARRALADNDALAALEGAAVTIKTGSTGTNVNDLHVVVVR